MADNLKWDASRWGSEVHLYARIGGGAVATWVVYTDASLKQGAPFLALARESAKDLMNALWAAGVRPSGYNEGGL